MREWWRDAVIYQIYPRSFQDDNGDGIGDLKGITRRLDYVASLGVDAIWLSPFFTSPDKDMGYDVSDYTSVNAIFGTIDDFDALMAKAHDLGLKVIIDQVLSHTSDQHPWFIESRKDKTNPKADWYVWADPQKDGTPPTNWPSVFGGSAWMFDARRRQYYLHNFLVSQPDLNFHNPEVIDALVDAMRFWLERGVDGFRLDTVNYYVHDKKLRDNPASNWDEFPGNPYEAQTHLFSKTQPENIAILKRIRALMNDFEDRMLIGEVGEDGLRQVEVMGQYTSGGDKLHMAYSFAMLSHDHSPDHFRNCISEFLNKAPDGWPCWSFSNHDVQRHVTRWATTPALQNTVARQAINMLVSFPGALGIYQGEELGQIETDIEFHELRDLGYIDFWPDNKGRDGCRTPMVWDANQTHAGFSTGEPWLPVKAPQIARSVSEQEGKSDTVLQAYRAALTFRKDRNELRYGETSFPKLPDPLLAVARRFEGKTLTGVFNLSDTEQAVDLSGGAILAGEKHAALDKSRLTLPAFGFAFVETQDEGSAFA
ncbi:alpha-glucosidase [Pacificibacter maritimus]|uniref:Alpha-glucosidase n=1 Tax=Pacificibacter maritimus TaxID=762213 RepID=A0A3N4UN19_9RHOB|nr:alpha-amylase family glycosyl hydrolase [Pacificibacter maritimus]RPE66447.1 alpha-glucosidase [Pacificibacter maritimus]